MRFRGLGLAFRVVRHGLGFWVQGLGLYGLRVIIDFSGVLHFRVCATTWGMETEMDNEMESSALQGYVGLKVYMRPKKK